MSNGKTGKWGRVEDERGWKKNRDSFVSFFSSPWQAVGECGVDMKANSG